MFNDEDGAGPTPEGWAEEVMKDDDDDGLESPEVIEDDGQDDESDPVEDEASTAAPEAPDVPPEGTAEEEGQVPPDEGAPVDPTAEAPPVDGTPDAGEQPEYEPFALKADGTEIPIEGAFVTKDGWVAVPRDNLIQSLRPFLADRTQWRRERVEYERRLQDAQSTKGAKEAEADFVLQYFENLLGQGGDAVWEWVQDFDRNFEVMQMQRQLALSEHQNKMRQATDEQTTKTEHAERIRQWAPQAVSQAAQDVVASPAYRELGLDPQDVVTALQRLGPQTFMAKADEDIPEWGVKKGAIFIRPDVVSSVTESLAGVARRLRTQTKDTREARKTVDRATGKKKGAPPVVTPGREAGVMEERKEQPGSVEEWKDLVFADD